MKTLFFLHFFFYVTPRQHFGAALEILKPPWATALVFSNSSRFLVPFQQFPVAFFIENDVPYAVTPPSPIVDAHIVVLPSQIEAIVVALRTCVVAYFNRGQVVHVLAGSCSQQGSRLATPLFSRFNSIIAVSGFSLSNLILIDQKTTTTPLPNQTITQVIVLNQWKAQALPLALPSSPRLVSMIQGQSFALLAVVAWGTSNMTLFAISSGNLTLLPHQLHQHLYLDSGHGQILSVALMHFAPHLILVWASSQDQAIHRFEVSFLNEKTLLSSYYAATEAITKLVPLYLGMMGSSSSSFIQILNSKFQVLLPPFNNSQCYNLTTLMGFNPCMPGQIIVTQGPTSYCVASPPGGYAQYSVFVPCKAGTFNPTQGASDAQQACVRCPPGFVSPADRAVVCTSCNATHYIQSHDGIHCLSACPEHQFLQAGVCAACQEAGKTFDRGVGNCIPCAGDRVSLAAGSPCTPCPPRFLRPPTSSSRCSVQCPLTPPQQQYGVEEEEQGVQCSPNGLEDCSFRPDPIYVETVENVQAVLQNVVKMLVFRNSSILFVQQDTRIFHWSTQNQWLVALHVTLADLTPLTHIADAVLSLDERILYFTDSRTSIVTISNFFTPLFFLTITVDTTTPFLFSNQEPWISHLTSSSLGLFYYCEAQQTIHLLHKQSNVTMHHARVTAMTTTLHGQEEFLYVANTTAACTEHAIFRLRIANQSIAAWLVASFYFSTPVPACSMPWISYVWGKAILFALGHGIYQVPAQAGEEARLIAGSLTEPGHVDDLGTKSRFIQPHWAWRANHDQLMLWQPHTHSIRIMYRRGCECAQDHFYHELHACMPCPTNTHSMPGSSGCSSCPAGSYFHPSLQACRPCPQFLWWEPPYNDYSPCQKYAAALGSSTFPPYKLSEIQASWQNTNTDVFLNENVAFAQDLDDYGRFWTFQPSLQVWSSSGANNLSGLAFPGIWTSCGLECNCSLSTFVLPPAWANTRLLLASYFPLDFGHATLFVVHLQQGVARVTKTDAPFYYDGPPSINSACWMGWPSLRECEGPFQYWDVAKLSCTPCPPHMSKPDMQTPYCLNTSAEFNPTCTPGFYKNGTTNCVPCPPGTFSASLSQPSCSAKRKRCLANFFMQLTGPTQDHQCVECVMCNPFNETMIPAYDRNPCDGIITKKPYTCFRQTSSRVGYWAQLVAVAGGDVSSKVNFQTCASNPAVSSTFQWTSGPLPEFCYIACKYDIDTTVLSTYQVAFYQDFSPFKWNQQQANNNNAVPYSPLGASAALHALSASWCLPCNLSRCPDNTWRPIYQPSGCGAPCLLQPSLCRANSTDGCIESCFIPPNATFLSYDASTSMCYWSCNAMFFLSDDSTHCIACSKLVCPPGTFYVGDMSCAPYKKLSSVCIPCSTSLEGAILKTNQSDPGVCQYDCVQDTAYRNVNPLTMVQQPCIVCQQLSSVRCEPGFRSICAPNPCVACPPLSHYALQGIASYVRSNQSQCRVVCNEYYHTIDVSSRQIIAPNLQNGHDPLDIFCQSCFQRSDTTCQSTLSCPENQYIDVAGTQCLPCKDSIQKACAPGFFAPKCVGGRIPQPDCVNCPRLDILANPSDRVPYTWPSRFFIPHTAKFTRQYKDLSEQDQVCPFRCVANSIYVNGSCVACMVLFPTPPPQTTYIALWNATPGLRWWPRENDPPHLPQRTYNLLTLELLPELRNNTCWPCPLNSIQHPYESNEHEICKAPTSSSSLQVFTITQNFSFWPAKNGTSPINTKRRKLLSHQQFDTEKHRGILDIQNNSWLAHSCPPGHYPGPPMAYWCTKCPKNYYCHSDTLFPCPPKSYTPTDGGAARITQCQCLPGLAMSSSTHSCVLESLSMQPNTSPVLCPRGSQPSKTSSSAALLVCLPCIPGTYEFNGVCAPCPLHHHSDTGSTQCTPMHFFLAPPLEPCEKRAFTGFCLPSCLDPLGTYDEFNEKCVCKPGSSWDTVVQKCRLCPTGTYTTKAANAPCTPCPPTQPHTEFLGASNIDLCIE